MYLSYLIPPEYVFQLDPVWEFPRELLELCDVLGEGAFGKVLRGLAHCSQIESGRLVANKEAVETGEATIVAVKMLKEGHTDSDMIDLVQEMEMMKMVMSPTSCLCCRYDCCSIVRLGPTRILSTCWGCALNHRDDHSTSSLSSRRSGISGIISGRGERRNKRNILIYNIHLLIGLLFSRRPSSIQYPTRRAVSETTTGTSGQLQPISLKDMLSFAWQVRMVLAKC